MDLFIGIILGFVSTVVITAFLQKKKCVVQPDEVVVRMRGGLPHQIEQRSFFYLPLFEDIQIIKISPISLHFDFPKMQDHRNLPVDVSIQFQICFSVRDLLFLLKEVPDIQNALFWREQLYPIMLRILKERVPPNNSELRKIIEEVHLPFSAISIRQVEVFSAHTPLSSFDSNNIEDKKLRTAARRYFVSLEELEQYHDQIEKLLDTSSILQSKLLNRRDRIDNLHAEIVERQSFIRQYAAQLLLQTQQRFDHIQQQMRERASQLRKEAKNTSQEVMYRKIIEKEQQVLSSKVDLHEKKQSRLHQPLMQKIEKQLSGKVDMDTANQNKENQNKENPNE
jgi:hypothetical protein